MNTTQNTLFLVATVVPMVGSIFGASAEERKKLSPVDHSEFEIPEPASHHDYDSVSAIYTEAHHVGEHADSLTTREAVPDMSAADRVLNSLVSDELTLGRLLHFEKLDEVLRFDGDNKINKGDSAPYLSLKEIENDSWHMKFMFTPKVGNLSKGASVMVKFSLNL